MSRSTEPPIPSLDECVAAGTHMVRCTADGACKVCFSDVRSNIESHGIDEYPTHADAFGALLATFALAVQAQCSASRTWSEEAEGPAPQPQPRRF